MVTKDETRVLDLCRDEREYDLERKNPTHLVLPDMPEIGVPVGEWLLTHHLSDRVLEMLRNYYTDSVTIWEIGDATLRPKAGFGISPK